MNRQDILDKLRSDNEHLNKVTEQYLLSHLDKPILGNKNFDDIKYYLKFGLNEHRIHNYQEDGYDYEQKTIAELCEQLDISETTYEQFKNSVNDILKSYTDYELSEGEKRSILEGQIKAFISKVDYDEEDKDILKSKKSIIKMSQKINNTIKYQKNRYLNSVLSAMEDAKVNQMDNNKYMIISSLLETYGNNLIYLDKYAFEEKKKYLQKIKCRDPISLIQKIFKNQYENILILEFCRDVADKNITEIKSLCNSSEYKNKHNLITRFCSKMKCDNSSIPSFDKYVHEIYTEALISYLRTKNPSAYSKIIEYNTIREIKSFVEEINDTKLIEIYFEAQKKAIETLNWFFFYLIYGKNKINFFMIHSILGYSNKNNQKLFQKLFCKDKTAGVEKKGGKDFLYHTSIKNATLETTVEYPEPIKYNPLYKNILKYL